MKVAIVYGCRKGGITNYCVNIVKEHLTKKKDVAFDEIWLNKTLPELCIGCVNCITKSKTLCVHYEQVKAIEERLIAADALIYATPTYGFNMSGVMKNFVDHFCYSWMVHRPNPEMFNKVAFLVTTAAGGGINKTLKSLKMPIRYMGAKRVLTYGRALQAAKTSEISHKHQMKLNKDLEKKAERFYRLSQKGNQLKMSISTRFLFNLFGMMIQSYNDDNPDKIYWKEQGWLEKERPY